MPLGFSFYSRNRNSIIINFITGPRRQFLKHEKCYCFSYEVRCDFLSLSLSLLFFVGRRGKLFCEEGERLKKRKNSTQAQMKGEEMEVPEANDDRKESSMGKSETLYIFFLFHIGFHFFLMFRHFRVIL